MAFGVSKGFGLQERLERQILEALPNQREVALRIIDYAHAFLENTQGGIIAGVGVAVLIWVVIRLMGNIEKSLNDIWGIRKGRSLRRKFADYLSLMIIAPLLFVVASSVAVLITSQAALLAGRVPFLATAGPIASGLLKLLPFAAAWALFTLLYVFMPNTNVKLESGLLGGVLAGTLYQVVQWVYIKFQVGASAYGVVYGSFAALPLFLVWLHTSWLVVLFGAEISFAVQNEHTYEFEPDCERVSDRMKRVVALRLVQICAEDFQAGKDPRNEQEFAAALGIPMRLIREVLSELVEARVLSEVGTDGQGAPAYQPAMAAGSLTVGEVVTRLDRRGVDEVPCGNAPEWSRLAQQVDLFEPKIRDASILAALKDR
jgi:membrane protein